MKKTKFCLIFFILMKTGKHFVNAGSKMITLNFFVKNLFKQQIILRNFIC